MVGVETSKGCKTCRRRKVKCDERKPTCHRCEAASIKCEGYPGLRLKWVDEGQSPREFSPVRLFLTVYLVPRLSRGRGAASPSPVPGRSTSQTGLSMAAVAAAGTTGITRELDLSPFCKAILTTYLTQRFFDGGHPGQPYPYQSWIANALSENDSNSAHIAVQCFAAIYHARRHGNDSGILAHAFALYDRAIRQLNEDISNPQTRFSHSNVSAAFALNLYEIWAYTGSVGWIQHAGGVGVMIERLGAAYFQEYPAHGTFLLSRIMILMRAYVLREPCFLETEEWTTVPWAKHPETKTDECLIIDLAARISGLQHERRQIDAIRDGNLGDVTEKLEALKVKFLKLTKATLDWRMRWKMKHPNVMWEMPPLTYNGLPLNEHGNPVHDTVFYFEFSARRGDYDLRLHGDCDSRFLTRHPDSRDHIYVQ
ncbi:hypothetical protein NA57DRAFT_57889 [Rhizodiscina lignyota]|uniref:Zn(2)-C6 fungal-type domain-containing protein n=1 Tax=Rhizodiscina lignyota TaxID=1504668 RepID=A0A9P4ICR9_9PEZI|nr:hypothetical protein NA57DRAFT_57889 [Rhizodiscina lignyota]